MDRKGSLKSSIPTFEKYLKLISSTSDVLGKIHEMEAMDTVLRLFFSNFTIHPVSEESYKGSTVTIKLNEPWEGFVVANDFVLGAR